ncbi:MAG: thioredoxin domain-containing protein [Alphaproteobacteria bacterium]|nr:thioredoxin domain-containing protein [Alphaproteobacteria bacterium]
MSHPFKRNRLAEATSPYLLQHKDNPVHWQPWEPEVFEEARARNLPVLLSIGYAACHWCHVMAHESFEDEEVAKVMNEKFICIKLDREERPDLDEIYMTALSMMGEPGGWPLTMCLDADARPFWGGTYFPKLPNYGRPGFMQILEEISRIWHETPDKIEKNTQTLTQGLRARAKADARGDMPEDLPSRAATTLSQHIDLQKGGLQGAPKFPQAFLYQFLWQQAQLDADTDIRNAVLVTLEKICQGGMYDHIGGGFARYSVDADWLVPHFEKMLYDNALLVQLMTQVWRDTKSPLLAARIAETLAWVTREMTLETGAFAASLDADTEGIEGKFYVWSRQEIEQLLSPTRNGEAFCQTYDITEVGNFEGHNIANLLAQGDGVQTDLATARALLLQARNQRIAPGRDDKILADWNAMMIAAMAQAGLAFGRDDWLSQAKTAFVAARQALTDAQGNLRHSAREGRVLAVSLSSDYAFLGQAALALYQATREVAYLDYAKLCADSLHADFYDDPNLGGRGGYLTNRQSEAKDVLVNNRPVQDNAMPSGNAAIYQLFASLATLTGEASYRALGQDLFTALAGHLASQYTSMTSLLVARQMDENSLTIILIGDVEGIKVLEKAARQHRVFSAHILVLSPEAQLSPTHPAHGKTQVDAKPTAYVCPGQTCLAPITDPQALVEQLDAVIKARQKRAD